MSCDCQRKILQRHNFHHREERSFPPCPEGKARDSLFGILRRNAMFIPTYKWGQTETHVVITVDAASIESHSVYPDGRCEIHGQVAGKVALTPHPLPDAGICACGNTIRSIACRPSPLLSSAAHRLGASDGMHGRGRREGGRAPGEGRRGRKGGRGSTMCENTGGETVKCPVVSARLDTPSPLATLARYSCTHPLSRTVGESPTFMLARRAPPRGNDDADIRGRGCSFVLPQGAFALRLELYGGIVADAAQTSVTPRCIRLKVPKAEPVTSPRS